MPIVWTENQTLKLVILYSRHECLRNPFHPDFKNKLCRYKAYKEIVDCMNICGLTVCDCIKRITCIKAQYCYELSKISAAISCEKVYKPKANWFPIMHEILFPFIETYGCANSSWPIRNNENNTYKDYYNSKINDQLIHSNMVELRKTPSNDCSCTYASCCCGEPYKTKLPTHSKKHWILAENDKVIDSVPKNCLYLHSEQLRQVDAGCNTRKCIIVEHEVQTDISSFKTECVTCQTCIESSTIVQSNSKNINRADNIPAEQDNKGKRKAHDEFDMFGKSIAFQLRNINFEIAIKLERRIQDLIAQERLNNIKSKYVSHGICSDCSSSCSDCKVTRKEMICSCGLPVIMIKTDTSDEFGCK